MKGDFSLLTLFKKTKQETSMDEQNLKPEREITIVVEILTWKVTENFKKIYLKTLVIMDWFVKQTQNKVGKLKM